MVIRKESVSADAIGFGKPSESNAESRKAMQPMRFAVTICHARDLGFHDAPVWRYSKTASTPETKNRMEPTKPGSQSCQS